ncbi:metal-dependent hydrolase [Halosolutus gelatinilyticus]|uniref:metal-dependent hydrolase n=1 Tax=Halosolutus gelatinilyticus TaxID=2931975 RepID=UPI001FF3239A|nr:metal-dependent hydrolase [Halosolutus gelatinilyticus]
MWPWGHLAVAYLCYAVWTHVRFDRPPRALPAIALAIGSQTPDLVDKPLAWTFGVLPGGRTLAHSLFVATLVVSASYAIGVRFDRREIAGAFGLGYYSHLLADLPPDVLTGDVSGAAYLLWPILEQPPEEPVSGLLDAIFNYYAMGPYQVFQLVLFAVAAAVWYVDGRPGVGYVRASIDRLGRLAQS